MLLYNFEGPKGTGKSTLSKLLATHYELHNRVPVEIRHFDSDNIVSYKDLLDTENESYDLIFDRGLLSYQLYDWLWDNGLSEAVDKDYLGLAVSLKQPVNKNHFDTLMNEIRYKYVILYSSNPKLLEMRIEKRKHEDGKGMTSLEKQTLRESNAYYKAMGEFLKYLYPDKVLLIDIADEQTPEELMEQILHSWW